ncbi:MAG: pyridoxal 5-phosphate synthase glutaminase subunit PdxT [Gammaproteobacteria bacterium]|jgi:5'-phosphate synthase pdxT subunit|nr:pyridoxal 5-phosphate synthase glutaminase subunit PdxT [Gammaproteobacteria bacterium]
MTIGILALQGGYVAHAHMLDALSISWKYIRQVRELAEVRALILPGGESSTMLRLLRETGLFPAIQTAGQRGMPLFGTCAGAILLAKKVYAPEQDSLGMMDIAVKRNAYGRQLASCVAQGSSHLKNPMEMVFIRAPEIEILSSEVQIIAAHEKKPVCVQQGRCLAATFHPELGHDTTLHAYFVGLLGQV